MSRGRRQPGADALGVPNASEVLDEPQPRRLADVRGIRRRQAMGAGDRPHEARKPVDEGIPCLLVAVGSRKHELREPGGRRRGAFGSAHRGGNSRARRLSYYHRVDEAERSATTAAQRVRDAWLNSDESPYAVHEQDGSGYVYAKNELLVLADDYKRLQSSPEARKIEAESQHADNLGVVRFRLAPQPDTLERLTIPQLVDQLRNGIESADRKAEPLRVGPNHVVSGEPESLGGPATAAKATTTPANVRGRLGRGVHVTVIDT